MAYDHVKKAGNRGDVWKHFVLVTLADKLPGNSDTVRYIECHAGAPLHKLKKPGEWQGGIGKILKEAMCSGPYVEAARKWPPEQYPASWVFVADRLARRFKNVRVTLFDTSEGVAARYQPGIAVSDLQLPDRVQVKFQQEDGYEAAERGTAELVFLDPPFYPDANNDRERLKIACQSLASRGLAFAAWYPLVETAEPKDTWPRQLLDLTKSTAFEVVWRPNPNQKLNGCGMLVSNDIASLLQESKDELTAMAKWMGSELTVRQPSRSSM